MNTVNMPGFNAEASMYMASNIYRAAHAAFADVASPRIIPQQCRLVARWYVRLRSSAAPPAGDAAVAVTAAVR